MYYPSIKESDDGFQINEKHKSFQMLQIYNMRVIVKLNIYE